MRRSWSASLASMSFLALAALTFGAAATEAGCARATPCKINSDCVQGVCNGGTCEVQCEDAVRDCAEGQRCYAGQCVSGEGAGASGPGGGGAGAAGGGEGGAGATGGAGPGGSGGATTGTTSSTTTSGSGGGGTKGELDPCATDAECGAALTCEPMSKGGGKRCTRSCTSDASCPSGMRCTAVDAEQFCAMSDVGKACGGAAACNFGCLQGPGYCTVACVTGSDCPNGYGCMGIGNPPTKVCVKAEAYCEPGNTSACIVPAACDTTSLLVGACTLGCNTSADCPKRAAPLENWTCSGGLCARPSDVYGPLPGGWTPTEWHCDEFGNPVSLCSDAQHMNFQAFSVPPPPAVNCSSQVTFAGQAGDACVSSCRYQGGCPFGYACTAVGNIGGSRVGLCLPTGGGEVGAACSNDTQCAFGFCNQGKCSRDCTADGVCPGGSTCTAAGGPAPDVEGKPFRKCL